MAVSVLTGIGAALSNPTIAGFLGQAGTMLGAVAGTKFGGVAKVYNNVQVYRGRIYVPSAKGMRMLGYTPREARKKFRTHRRSRRLTKRDQAIINAMAQNPAAALGLANMLT